MTVSPSGLRHADAILARNLFGATPAEAVESGRVSYQILYSSGHIHSQRLVPELFVTSRYASSRERPSTRGVTDREDFEDLLRDRFVLVEVRTDDYQVRTEPHGARHRNGRAHAKLSRFVACGCHHRASLAGRPQPPAGP